MLLLLYNYIIIVIVLLFWEAQIRADASLLMQIPFCICVLHRLVESSDRTCTGFPTPAAVQRLYFVTEELEKKKSVELSDEILLTPKGTKLFHFGPLQNLSLLILLFPSFWRKGGLGCEVIVFLFRSNQSNWQRMR